MSKRSYHQYCGLAVALDVLGERWSILLLRNLMVGPKRFKDLHDGLPGIGTGMLTDRLRHLEEAGVIHRVTLPPPAGSAVYELTPDGEALRPALVGLARWGLARLGDPDEFRFADPDTMAIALEARFDPAGGAPDGDYQVVLGERCFTAAVRAGTMRVRAGEAHAPIATVSTDLDTAIALNRGRISLVDAIGDGAVVLRGDGAAAWRFAQALGL